MAENAVHGKMAAACGHVRNGLQNFGQKIKVAAIVQCFKAMTKKEMRRAGTRHRAMGVVVAWVTIYNKAE